MKVLIKKQRDFPNGSVVKKSACQCRRQVQSLIQEDPTCCGAAKPVLLSLCPIAHAPRQKKPPQ